VPVAATTQSKNIVCFDCGDDVVVEADPLISGMMDPSHVVTTVGGPTLVSDNCHELVVACVEAQAVLSVQCLIVSLVFLSLHFSFGSFSDKLLPFLCLFLRLYLISGFGVLLSLFQPL
jgi:hypothetical protein